MTLTNSAPYWLHRILFPAKHESNNRKVRSTTVVPRLAAPDHGGTVYATRVGPRKKSATLVALLLAATAFLTIFGSGSAMAAEPDEYEYHFVGNVTYQDKPLEGVRMSVEGNGFENETLTDVDGKWILGVPEDGKYTITLDESTLPKGVAVTEKGGNSKEAEFGVTNRKAVNFFLGVGVRTTTSVGDQLLERIVNGLNFGLMLALASIGLSLVFGTTGISNFAHGEMVTFGALAALLFTGFGWSIWLAIPLAVIVSAGFGLTMDAG